MLGEGKTIAEVARALEISENSYHRWRNQYGGMKADDAKRLKELGRENARLPGPGEPGAEEDPQGKLVSPPRRACGGRDASRPPRRLRALGLPGRWSAPFHPTSCAGASGARSGAQGAAAGVGRAGAAVGIPPRSRHPRERGWVVNCRRVQRCNVGKSCASSACPQAPAPGRFHRAAGRLRAEHPGHVWAFDF